MGLFWDVVLIPLIELQKSKYKPYQNACEIYEVDSTHVFELDCYRDDNNQLLKSFDKSYENMEQLYDQKNELQKKKND